jgi:transposase
MEVYDRHRSKKLSCEQAADLLGISVRTYLRKRNRYEEGGEEGLNDGRLRCVSPRRASEHEVEFMTKLYNERYRGFSVRHFYDFARTHHQLARSYNWCRLTLQSKGVVGKSTKGGKHRLRRERKPMAGMMLHQDASTHMWVPALGYNVDLVVTMDDATSTITSAFLCAQEGTHSSLQGIKETIQQYGLFCSLYTDRGSHYTYTPEAGGKVDKSRPTQVGQVLKQLGIRHIHAYSPQARGRSERMFGTLQGRLPKEMEVLGIRTLEEANRYLRAVYIHQHNKHFSVAPKDTVPGYTPWLHQQSLDEVICIKQERTVQNDNTVHYEGILLQIPPNAHRYHYVRAQVEVREYVDRTLSVFYGHHCLGRYNQAGTFLEPQFVGQDKETLEKVA